MGYLLVAFLASEQLAVEAAMFYLVACFVTTLGAFRRVSVLSSSNSEPEQIEDYRGLFWRRLALAGMFTFLLLSLAGIPLTAGFIGKFYIVAAGIPPPRFGRRSSSRSEKRDRLLLPLATHWGDVPPAGNSGDNPCNAHVIPGCRRARNLDRSALVVGDLSRAAAARRRGRIPTIGWRRQCAVSAIVLLFGFLSWLVAYVDGRSSLPARVQDPEGHVLFTHDDIIGPVNVAFVAEICPNFSVPMALFQPNFATKHAIHKNEVAES